MSPLESTTAGKDEFPEPKTSSERRRRLVHSLRYGSAFGAAVMVCDVIANNEHHDVHNQKVPA
jgi:hypothetical protein